MSFAVNSNTGGVPMTEEREYTKEEKIKKEENRLKTLIKTKLTSLKKRSQYVA